MADVRLTMREAPLRQARRFAETDLRGDTANLAWLHAHQVLWLRALIAIEEDINDQLAKSRTDLAGLKPPGGEHPSRAYLAAKREQDERRAGRLHFKRLVTRRKAEVITLLGADPPAITGDLIRALAEAVKSIDEDDVEHARGLLLHWADRLAAEQNRK